MTENNITPPPELVQQWVSQCVNCTFDDVFQEIAQWGANQELEACCHEVQNMYSGGSRLRAARRPKPPSLKEQLLNDFDWLMNAKGVWTNSETQLELLNRTERIRLALEQLDD